LINQVKNFKTHIALLLYIFSSTMSFGQTYGNEWINYNQTYYSFKIVNTGVYKLDYSTLAAAGIPLSSFQSQNIQVFGKEKELPLYVIDNGDNSIDAGDFILFYAERNDGWLDSTIYLDPETIGNPAYSLYNDTIEYFFTWNNSTSNLRYSVETDMNFAGYSSIEDYILYTHEFNYNNGYQEGVRSSQNSSSFYMPGEGWGTGSYNGVPSGTTLSLTANTPAPYSGPGAPNALFKGLSSSSSNAASTGTGNHHLRWEIGASNTVLADTIFNSYAQIKISKEFSPSILSNGSTSVNWRIINDQNAATDFQAFNYFSINYPRTTNFQGNTKFNFNVKNNPQGKIRIDATNVGASNPMLFVHGDTPRIIPFANFGAGRSALIPNSGNGVNQLVIYMDSSQILLANNLKPVNGNGSFTNFMTYPGPGGIEEALLFIYHPKLYSSTVNYEAHRTSAAGGGYNVVMANVNELYQQFGGGIEKHVNGVRRFSHFIYNNSSIKPVGLFLLGKGIREAEYNSALSDGPGSRKNAQRFHESLIPSFGQPSSDVCITANLEGSFPWSPLIPTGRISARTEVELNDYLDKVITHDANQDPNSIYDTPNKDWQKHILHFAGGSNITEQIRFQNYMIGYENTIEDSLFGGVVHSVFKQSSNPLDPTILSGITDRIEKGVSLMSYFGHSSSTGSGFEINLDQPTNWNNTGKYPMMLVNSCYNGNIFQLALSKSEEFVQVANYGAIGYIASVSVGFDIYLNQYSRNFYKLISRDKYGATIGSQMQQNINDLYLTGLTNPYLESTCTQMVLNGDPMVKLNWHQNPEIELLEQNVSFFPNDINLTVDSIEVRIILTNLGHSTLDTFNLEITRGFPSSSVDSIYNFIIPKLNYKDTLRFKVPLQPNISVGMNTFNIRADLPSVIGEQYDEINNNHIVKTLFIKIDGIIPVVPYDFAVVPEDSVTVRASTVNPIASYRTYRFELDTTDLFNSPMHRFALVSGLGGVKEVNPSEWKSVSSGLTSQLVCTDSTVYFWRVAIDSVVLDWRERSFQYITNKTGWGQDHFFQFKKNGFFGIDYDRPNRKRDFGLFSKLVTCDAYSSTAVPDIYDNNWALGGDQQDYGILNYTPKLHVAVIDPVTLISWGTRFVSTGENLGHNFGNNNDNYYTRPWKYFTFHQDDPAKLAAFQNMVNNEVPDGHYILIYSPLETRYDWWNSTDSTNMYNTFVGLGSDSINGNRVNAPFAFFCKKGDPSSVVEVFAQGIPGEVHLTATAFGSDEGQEASPLIGPSSKWGNVYWKQDPSEVSSADSTVLTISTYNMAGVLQSNIDMPFTLNDSLIDLSTVVNASLYPYISLKSHYADYVTNTPAQIDRWHVLFDPLPEAAIDGTTAYLWSAGDTLSEGQTVDFAIDIRNIYSLDMDSLLVSYWVEDENQVKHPIPYIRQDSLRVSQVIRDTITFSTVGLGGINSLWVEVNPYVNGSLYITDQPEQEHFNNLLQIPFYVIADDKNPILDVTFNGNHILNGDIIDPSSEILITLKDDNDFLIMDNVSDTALFGIYLTYPSGNVKRIPFTDAQGNTVMQWIPAETQNKRFKIIWPSEFTEDGKYTLMVQGTDRSGNVSGDIDYRVMFEVIHESSITNMMNYPNPFSTSTRFVFTLTGSEEPDDILIQIMTVTGRVVKEINESEIGPIYIGRNITEFAWDGTDEFGDPLANGVYLYRVKAKINGEDIKHRESGADVHFRKDFGKMYLMR
jgi:hypothetical protein